MQFAIEGQYFLVPAVMPQIQGLYRNGDFFFPVTFKEYLQYMLEDGVWGDQVALYLIARMWNMKISILVAGGQQVTAEIYEVPLHHQGGMVEADIMVVFNGHGHYSPVIHNDKMLVSAAKCTWHEDDQYVSLESKLLQPDEDLHHPNPTFVLPWWDKFLQKQE